MPEFDYKGIDSSGRTVSGVAEAAGRKQAVQRLTAQGIRPTSVKERNQQAQAESMAESVDFFAGERKNEKSKKRRFRRQRRGSAIALSFLQQLLVLVSAGMPLGDSLRLLSQRLSEPTLKQLANDLWRSISEGRTLAGAMAEHPKIFSESNVHLIEAGESSGNLVPVLERVVAYMEETAEIRRNMIASLLYPIFVIGIALAVVCVFLFFLLPRIRAMLESLGGEMQWLATALIGGSDIAIKAGPFVILAVILAAWGIRQWRKTPTGLAKTDLWLLRIPAIGTIYLYANIFQTSNLMATLLDSGVNTTETLRLVERTITNTQLRAKFSAARKQIQEGVSMATAIKRVRYMPDVAMDILSVGENTGNIATSLNDINKLYRSELTKRLNRLTTGITTGALFVAFGLVAIIALTMVFSILEVSNAIQAR